MISEVFVNDYVKSKLRDGECYSNVIYLSSINSEWNIVHGICVRNSTNTKMGHAWLELDEFCCDAFTLSVFDRAIFYRAGQVSYTAVYSQGEALELAFETNNVGPWDDRININSLHKSTTYF